MQMRSYAGLAVRGLGSFKVMLAAVAAALAIGCASHGPTQTAPGRSVAPVDARMSCGDLLGRNFASSTGVASVVTSAETVGSGKAVHCLVRGTITGSIQFEIRLPQAGWTQRFLMVGCGGYCGAVPAPSSIARHTAGCAPFETNQMVVAASDLGHQGGAADGAWARGNPVAIIDFAYAGMHKTTVVAKAVTRAYYGKDPSYAYFVGCSDGGREGLHEAQRYPQDYDGIVVGAPVIDEVATNTFYHAWHMRSNQGADGLPILTADKVPALAAAVRAACGDVGGLVQDPRACRFRAAQIQCAAGEDRPDCLTAAQVAVVEKVWGGPVDEHGHALSANRMPKGSELNWLGSIVPRGGKVPFTRATSNAFAFSDDFPNYMATFDTTGITNANMSFTHATYDKLMQLQTLWDPTNPDLSAFAARGGKLILWHGWQDQAYSSLNYFDAVRRQMGVEKTEQFLSFYLLPGVGHCNGGANSTAEDFLTPMLAWVENGRKPDRIDVHFRASATDATVLRTRPTYPYPSTVRHVGGDVNAASSYARAGVAGGVEDRFEWLGLSNYRPGVQMYCNVVDGKPVCERR